MKKQNLVDVFHIQILELKIINSVIHQNLIVVFPKVSSFKR